MKTAAVKYLKDVYGLEPEDVDLKKTDTIEDVDCIAEKYNLTKKSAMTFEKASSFMKRFKGGQ